MTIFSLLQAASRFPTVDDAQGLLAAIDPKWAETVVPRAPHRQPAGLHRSHRRG